MTPIDGRSRHVVERVDGQDRTYLVTEHGTYWITFDCGVCGYGFLTEEPMEACGKRRKDCPRSKHSGQEYAKKLRKLMR